MKRFLPLFPLAILAGCRGVDTSYLPLSVGTTWNYEVRGRKLTQFADIKVARTVAVDGVTGYELSGPLGVSRVAWHGSRLVADRLANTVYDPPVPLLDAHQPKEAVTWSGSLTSPMGTKDATASLQHTMTEVMYGSRKTPALESTLEVRVGHRVMELETWFVAGVGIVKQEERSDDLEIVRLLRTTG